MKEDIEVFLIEKGYSIATQETYRRILLDLISIPDLEQIGAAALLAHFDRPTWGNSIQYVSVSASRQFLAWRFGHNHPALSARVKRKKSKIQRSLDSEKLLTLLASFDPHTAKGRRDLAIVSVAVDARLRVSELSRLCFSDVDLETCTLQVIVKGGEWGERAFSEETANIILAYLSYRQPKPGVDRLFLSTQGLTKGSGMTVNGLKATVRRWGEKLGFRISPHDFCRTFALQTTKNNAPTRVVQVGGGWKGIDMVVHYTRGLELDAIRPYLPIKNLLG